MAISREAAIQEISEHAKKALPLLADNGKNWSLNLLEGVEVDNAALTGETQQAHIAYEIYGQSASGPISEATAALPTPNDEEGLKLTWTATTQTRSLGLSYARLDKLTRMGSKDRMLSTAKMINNAFNMQRSKRKAIFEGGRGGNVGARVFAAGSGTTIKCAPQVPILFQRGDEILAYSGTEADGERLMGSADAATLGTTSQRISRVKRDSATPEITLASGSTWSDDAVLVWKHAPTLAQAYGLPYMLDSVGDGTFKWDSEDGASADHYDVPGAANNTYFGQSRSTYPDLDCQILDAATNEVDIKHFSQAVGLCVDGNNGDDSVIGELVVGMCMRMWRRFVNNMQGAVRLTSGKLFLPGNQKGSQSVPMMTGKGINDTPILISSYIPDGFIMFIHRTKLRKIYSKPDWLPGTQGIWHLVPQASVAGYQADFHAYLINREQNGMFLPCSSCVAWNFDTSADV